MGFYPIKKYYYGPKVNDDATSSLALSSWSPFSNQMKCVMIGTKQSLHCLSETSAKTKCSILCAETIDSPIAHHEDDTFGLNQAESARSVKESAYNLKLGKDQPPSDLLRCKVDNLIRGRLPFEIY